MTEERQAELAEAAGAALVELIRLHPNGQCLHPESCPTAAAIRELELALGRARSLREVVRCREESLV